MDLIAVGTQVQVVEHTGGGPQVLGADGDRGYTVFLQLGTGCEQLVPGLRLGNAVLVEDVFAVIHAPLIVGVGNAPLLAVTGHGRLDRLERSAEVRIGRPQIGDVLDLAGIDERAHTVARVPGRHVRRAGRQEVPDGGLVSFTVIDAQIDGDVRVGRVKIGDDLFESGLRAGVKVIKDDDQLACERAAGHQGSSRGKACKDFLHFVLPQNGMNLRLKKRSGLLRAQL